VDNRRKHLALILVCALLGGELLLTSFRRGFTQVETDFPNYYTAAVLTLRGAALRNFYDLTWFQRQMNYTGTERQLGAYPPNTPLTMLPLLPLASLDPQRAKQVWLIFGLLFFAASIWMLALLTKFRPAEVLSLALVAYGALSANFVLGQYYLLLLFLLTASAWCLLRGRPFFAGALLGLIFALRLYTAPFLLYFAVRRQWKALAGMLASILLLAAAAIGIFGFADVWFYVTNILPRGLDGSITDPYLPGWGSMTSFLRHTFVQEAELNPHPLLEAPALFFFLRALYAFGVLVFALLALARDLREDDRAFAWFVIVLFALSPHTASYHFLLLLVPVALLLRGATRIWSIGLLALYALIQLPVRPWYAGVFPKAWLLLALLLYTGWRSFRSIRPATAVTAMAVVIIASAADALRRSISYRQEPPSVATHAVVDPGAIFSSAPAIAGREIVYQAMAQERYVIRSANAAGIRSFAFDGHALHPSVASSLIFFELVASRHSRICSFDPATRTLDTVTPSNLNAIEPAVSRDGAKLAFVADGSLYVQQSRASTLIYKSAVVSGPAFFPDGGTLVFAEGPPGRRSLRILAIGGGSPQTIVKGRDAFEPAVSPDGKSIAYVVSEAGGNQVWVRNLATGLDHRVTSGGCNNDSPAWRLDSRSIIFASDCSRGVGLPALYETLAQ
jgi:glycosyl transferase family 87/WD40 repeat protein